MTHKKQTSLRTIKLQLTPGRSHSSQTTPTFLNRPITANHAKPLDQSEHWTQNYFKNPRPPQKKKKKIADKLQRMPTKHQRNIKGASYLCTPTTHVGGVLCWIHLSECS